MSLNKGRINTQYTVADINSNQEMRAFLLTLGCYEGEEITIVSKLAANYIVSIKDARYSIDERLAQAIKVH